jgi:hypothetical protein
MTQFFNEEHSRRSFFASRLQQQAGAVCVRFPVAQGTFGTFHDTILLY